MCNCFPVPVSQQFPWFRRTMLPGYGFSPFPDFQPHLQAFGCRGDSSSMWIPGSGESQTLSEGQKDRPLLHSCHHKHVAVCQQETLAFIELQPAVMPKLNGLSTTRPGVIEDSRCTAHSLTLNGFKHSLNELNDRQNCCQRTYSEHQTHLSFNSHMDTDSELICRDDGEAPCSEQTDKSDKPRAVTTVCRPLHAALSLPLSFPLSSLYTNRDSWDSQLLSSPEGPGCQSPEPCPPQRRTSQGSIKEKSIRKLLFEMVFWQLKSLNLFCSNSQINSVHTVAVKITDENILLSQFWIHFSRLLKLQ